MMKALAGRFAGHLLFLLVSLGLGAGSFAGTITGNIVQIQRFNVNLTLQGTTDWAVWGQGSSASLNPSDRRLGPPAISPLTDISEGNPLRGLGQFGVYGESTFAWSNGTNTPIASNVDTGLQHDSNSGPNHNPVGEGFAFSVPASLSLQEVTIYFTVNDGMANFTASLSDGSATAFSQIFDSMAGANRPGILTLDFAAGSPAQTLTVQGVLTTGAVSQNIAIQAVTLGLPAAIPEPATYGLLGSGVLALLALRRRRE